MGHFFFGGGGGGGKGVYWRFSTIVPEQSMFFLEML